MKLLLTVGRKPWVELKLIIKTLKLNSDKPRKKKKKILKDIFKRGIYYTQGLEQLT